MISQAFSREKYALTYSDLTVADICRDAGLNKNSFYYHFSNLDDMAISLIRSSSDDRFAMFVLRSATEEDISMPEDIHRSEQYRHICLIAGENSSPWLAAALRESVINVWFRILGYDDADIPRSLYIASVFAVNGILAVLALNNKENDYSFVTPYELVQQDFVKSLMRSILDLKAAR